MLDFHIATSEEKREAFAQVHVVWPHAKDPDVHLVKRLHAVQQSRAQWFVGCSPNGVEVSCGAYPFTLFGPNGERRPTRALGAVYTHPRSRSKGYAGELIRFVRAHFQKEAISDFILYSDIDPAFYEALGFRRLPSLSFSIEGKELPQSSAWHLEDMTPRVKDPGRLGHEFGLALSDEELLWAQAKQDLPLSMTRFSNTKDPNENSYWALGAQEAGSYLSLMSNIPQDDANWRLFADLIAADAQRQNCKLAKGWCNDPSVASTTAQNISERKDGILMWSSSLGDKDPWFDDIGKKAFLSFPLLQI